MYKEEITQRVIKQEERTRKALDKLIPDLFKGCKIKSNPTSIFCNVDYQFTATTQSKDVYTYDVEVKEFDRDYEYIYILDAIGIKLEKYIRMKKFNEESGNDKLIYMVILNDAVVIYDLKKIDLNKCHFFLWEQRQTQYDYNSPTVKLPAMNLPLNQATYINYINKNKYYEGN